MENFDRIFSEMARHNIPMPLKHSMGVYNRWGKKNEYFLKYTDGYFVFGDFSRNLQEYHLLNVPSERKKYYTFREWKPQAPFEIQLDEYRNFFEALKCNQEWESASTMVNHLYLNKKKVYPYGLRQAGDRLMIPIRDAKNILWSIQTILPDGTKRFAGGARKSGGFHLIGELREPPFLICEGYATGASLHMATKLPVIVAFDANNMVAVMRSLANRYPADAFIIAADDDVWKRNGENTGIRKAMQIQDDFGCRVIAPDFDADAFITCGKQNLGVPTDWNDLHVAVGLNAVREQFSAFLNKKEG
jgi:putative DNA primase/helicase